MKIEWELGDKPSESNQRFVRPGTHEFKVIDAKAGLTREGDDKISLKLRVESGPDRGLHVWQNLNVGIKNNEKWKAVAIRLLRQLADAVGVEIKNPFDPGLLIDKRCKATTDLEEFNGRQNARIRGFQKSDLDSTDNQGDHESVDMPF